MFERYTEKARRVIFFARYEASLFGAMVIESEHLLLGLVREDRPMLQSFMPSPDSIEGIRHDIESRSTVREKISTSIDLPLSVQCKQALARAAEEAELLGHASISTEHLMLGLLRVEDCLAATLLKERSLDIAVAREVLSRNKFDRISHEPRLRTVTAAVPVLQVADLARSREWYRDVLGFAVKQGGSPGTAIVQRDGVEIMLQKVDHPFGEPHIAKAHGGWDAYIRIHDIRTLRLQAQEKLQNTVLVTQTEYGCLEFVLTDPDGHVIVFGECS